MMKGSFLLPLFVSCALIVGPVLAQLHPVILVPGLAGSVIKGKLHNKPHVPNIFCSKNSDWYVMWLSIEELLPGAVECLMDNLVPRYDAETKTYYAPEGVTLDTNVDFGGVDGLAYLDPDVHLSAFVYFEALIELLQGGLNYTVGKDLRGAPYDWRMAPDGLKDYFSKLTSMIELTFIANNNLPVHLVTHSMGGPVILHFLNQKSQAWKDTYVKSFIALAPPFGGSMQPVEGYVTGFNFGLSVLPLDYLRPVQSTAPSGAWILGQPSVFGADEVRVTTPSKNYTASTWKQLAEDLGLDTVVATWPEAVDRQPLETLQGPGVDVTVFYGSQLDTPSVLHYDSDFEKGKILKKIDGKDFELGDGTVCTRSALVAKNWIGSGKDVKLVDLEKQSHLGMLADVNSIKSVVDEIIHRSYPQFALEAIDFAVAEKCVCKAKDAASAKKNPERTAKLLSFFESGDE